MNNFIFDRRDFKIISDWFKQSRETTDIKIITDKIEYTNEKLNQLVYMVKANYNAKSAKEIADSLNISLEELEFYARILLSTRRATSNDLNVILKSVSYNWGKLSKRDHIGYVRL